MGKHQFQSTPIANNATTVREYIQGIYDGLIAAGWVQTADTGQVDPATATAASSSWKSIGYLVFRMNDAAQAIMPVFIKILFGSGGTASAPTTQIWVGSGSDGAGTITGVYRKWDSIANQTDSTASEYPCFVAGDGSSLAIVMWYPRTVGAEWMFFIDRSRSSAGVATDAAIIVGMRGSGVNSPGLSMVGKGGGETTKNVAYGALPVLLPYSVSGLNQSHVASLANGEVAPVFPIPCAVPDVAPWIAQAIVAVMPGDAGATSVLQTVMINGAARTYRAFQTASGSGLLAFSGVSPTTSPQPTVIPAILWED